MFLAPSIILLPLRELACAQSPIIYAAHETVHKMLSVFLQQIVVGIDMNAPLLGS